jgi:hypothetical protein
MRKWTSGEELNFLCRKMNPGAESVPWELLRSDRKKEAIW